MSLPPAAAPTQPEGPRLPGEHRPPSEPKPMATLPPVEAPSGTFILQLFLIPLLIVTMVVVLWLMFSWLASMGRDDPAELAKSIRWGDAASWQRSYELADLLRSPDPKYDKLRRDTATAASLATFLESDLKVPVEGAEKEVQQRIMRRMFLCRALGAFHVPTALDVLLKAATQEVHREEIQVRFSAIEAIAALADNCGPAIASDAKRHAKIMEVLLAASAAQDTADESTLPLPPVDKDGKRTLYRPHAELRAVAAYALGVLGGDEATARLKAMLHDTYPNARYNAATGLARAGDVECERVLKEMLDPTNDVAIRDERYADDQARKRTTVLLNGIKGTLRLHEANPQADLSKLKESLTALANSPLENVQIERNKVKRAATEALERLAKK